MFEVVFSLKMLEFDEHASAPTVNQNMFGVLEEDEKIQVASLPEMCSQDHIEDVILAMSAKVPDTASPSFDIVANGTQVSHEAEEVYMGKKRRISALGDENPFHHISKQLELLPKDFDLIEEIGRQASEIAELKLKVGKMQAGLIMTTEALKKASKKISDGRLSNQHFRVLLELLQRHRTKPDAGSMELDNMMPSHDEDNCKPGDGLNWIALQNQSTPHYRLLLELLQTVATMKANDQVRPDSEDPTFLKKGLSTDDEADWKENVIKAKKQRCLLELMNLIARHQEEVISSLETKVHENQDKEKHEQLLSIVHSSLLKDFHQRELDTVNEQLETVVKEYSACMTKLRECTDLIESLRARASLDCASQTDEINSENAVEVCLGSNSNDCTSLSKECIDDFRATSQQMAISDDKVNQENRAPKNLPLIMNVSNLLQKPAVDNFDEKKLEDHSVQISSFSPDQFVISFSGFRDGQPGYDLETKAKLMELLESMGATYVYPFHMYVICSL